MPTSQLKLLRKACLALPDAHEVEAWGSPTFRVNNKLFAMYAPKQDHHKFAHESVWVKCTPINQSLMIGSNPKKFFSPPYVGPSGWIGVRLDVRVNWKELAGILRDGYDLTVVKKKRPSEPGRKRAPRAPRRNQRTSRG
jgi:predicted DNA-binding protein (MmcQ/YjbR family)